MGEITIHTYNHICFLENLFGKRDFSLQREEVRSDSAGFNNMKISFLPCIMTKK